MSQANYILICSGRGRVLASSDPTERVVHAMECAAALVCYVSLTNSKKKLADAAVEIDAISNLQHTMMDALPAVNRAEADAMVSQMFTLLDALEDRIAAAG